VRNVLSVKRALVAVLALASIPAFYLAAVAKDDEVEATPVEYTFGRPLREDERTYAWYRKTHADRAAERHHFDPEAVGDGMDTWHWWFGTDNPGFWRDLACLTGKKKANASMTKIDFLRMLMMVPRSRRFEVLGLINDPDCVAAEGPDRYGLTLDRMKDGTLTWDPEKFGYSSGVIGLQLVANKKFNEKNWSLNRYLDDPSSCEPPYNVGMACALCHVAFKPTSPPLDPNEPKWENLDSAIGNQYMREGMFFGYDLPRSSFAYQYLYHQQPGTSETTRFPSDFINNPVIVNSIYRLPERLRIGTTKRITPAQRELMESMYAHCGLKKDDPSGALGGTAEEPTIKSPNILSTGSDDFGVLMASTRVYVNLGMSHEIWPQTWGLNIFDPASSVRANFATSEFDIIGKARKDPNSPWMQTEVRMPNMATFLSIWDGNPLAEAIEAPRLGMTAPGATAKDGKGYFSSDPELLRQGRIAFADNCARCHSSKRPESLPRDTDGAKRAWRELVLRDDFLKDNYLSDDLRYPCSELGTNTARAMSTVWLGGHTFGQCSSKTYKDERASAESVRDHDPTGKPILLWNPISGKYDIDYRANRSFYRTPTLVSIWATAPYLHNNSVGLYNGDPSISGRMEAYYDGMKKLLWPEKRDGIRSVKVTTEDSKLPDLFPVLREFMPELADFPGLELDLVRVPMGTPINLVMNIHPKDVKAVLFAYIEGVLQGEPKARFAELRLRNHDAGVQRMIAKMLEVNMCPDFIEDRGHTYGSELSDADKWALIEYMKHF
jgi:hypothetical protein